jgi:WD40 repeat protein
MVAISPNSDLVAIVTNKRGDPHGVRILDRQGKALQELRDKDRGGGRGLYQFAGGFGAVRSLDFGPSSQSLLLAEDKSVSLWNTSTGKIMGEYDAQSEFGIHAAAFVPGGKSIAVAMNTPTEAGDAGRIQLLRADTLQPLGTPLIHAKRIESMAVSPDGKLLAHSGDGCCAVWNLRTGTKVCEEPDDGLPAISLDFDPNSKRIAVLTKDSLRLWAIADCKPLRSMLKIPESYWRIPPPMAGFTRDGRYILTHRGLDKNVRLWRVAFFESPEQDTIAGFGWPQALESWLERTALKLDEAGKLVPRYIPAKTGARD